MLNWDDLYLEKAEEINYLTDRIQPYMLLKMPDKKIPRYVPSYPIYAKWEEDDLSQTWESDI